MSGMREAITPEFVAELAEQFGQQGFGLAPTMDDIAKLWAEDREKIEELEQKYAELDSDMKYKTWHFNRVVGEKKELESDNKELSLTCDQLYDALGEANEMS